MVATVPCGHAYHEHCLKSWATKRLKETDPDEAMKLHETIESLSGELSECEERWLELNEEV